MMATFVRLVFSAIVCLLFANDVLTQEMKLLKPGEAGIEQKMYFDIPYVEKTNLSVGERCMSSNECASGCCVVDRKKRVCMNLALTNEFCSSGQVKGGFYPRNCPCANDQDVCKRLKRKRRGRNVQMCVPSAVETTTVHN